MIVLMILSVILLSMLMMLLSTLDEIKHLISGNNYDWLLNLNLIYKIIDLNAGKTQLVSFDQSSNTGAIDAKMNGSVLQEKSSFKILVSTFSSKLDWDFYIISIAKAAFKKIGALICSMKFLSPRLLHISINLTYSHAWNTVVMLGLVLLFATCYVWTVAPIC